MSYSVKEIFYTLQGEGAQTGRPAVFCRFTGCNLWSGREGDRSTALCRFCDTDFVGTNGPGGGIFSTPDDLALAVKDQFPGSEIHRTPPLVVCTGGEPLLQLDKPLLEAFHRLGLEVAVGNQRHPASAFRDRLDLCQSQSRSRFKTEIRR